MILFWVLWVSLVLGGVVGYLAARVRSAGLGLRAVRVPARAPRPATRRDGGNPGHRQGRGDFLPLPQVSTRPGSAPGRLA